MKKRRNIIKSAISLILAGVLTATCSVSPASGMLAVYAEEIANASEEATELLKGRDYEKGEVLAAIMKKDIPSFGYLVNNDEVMSVGAEAYEETTGDIIGGYSVAEDEGEIVILLVKSDTMSTKALLQKLLLDKRVLMAEPNYIVEPESTESVKKETEETSAAEAATIAETKEKASETEKETETKEKASETEKETETKETKETVSEAEKETGTKEAASETGSETETEVSASHEETAADAIKKSTEETKASAEPASKVSTASPFSATPAADTSNGNDYAGVVNEDYNYDLTIYQYASCYDGNSTKASPMTLISKAKDGDNPSMNVPDWNNASKKNSDGVAIVMDDGIDYTHPDLKNVMYEVPADIQETAGGGKYGYRPGAEDETDPMCDKGRTHGTHVGGIIAAEWNDFGTSGVVNGTKLLGVNVADANGSFNNLSIIRGFAYIGRLVDAGVDVRAVNCSFGGESISAMELLASNNVGKKGVVVCWAAANESHDTTKVLQSSAVKADSPYCIVVGASDVGAIPDKSYSNYGMNVNVFAPGSDILSTIPVADAGTKGIFMPIAESKGGTRLDWETFDGDSDGDVELMLNLFDWNNSAIFSSNASEDGGVTAYGKSLGINVQNDYTLDKFGGALNVTGVMAQDSIVSVFAAFEVGQAGEGGLTREEAEAKANYISGFIGVGNPNGEEISTNVDLLIVTDKIKTYDELCTTTDDSQWTLKSPDGYCDEEFKACIHTLETKEHPYCTIERDGKYYVFAKLSLIYRSRTNYNQEASFYIDSLACGTRSVPYAFFDGTSMATPDCTGAVLVEYERMKNAGKLDGLSKAECAIAVANKVKTSVKKMPQFADMCTTGGIVDLSADAETGPLITWAYVDLGSEHPDCVLIDGLNFGKEAGTVTIGGTECDIVEWTDTSIIADRHSTESGTYLISLKDKQGHEIRGNYLLKFSNDRVFEYTVSIPDKALDITGNDPDMTEDILSTSPYIDSVVGVDGKLYLIKDDDFGSNSTNVSHLYVYDPAADEGKTSGGLEGSGWSIKRNSITSICGKPLCTLNLISAECKLYAYGFEKVNDVYYGHFGVYDPQTENWTELVRPYDPDGIYQMGGMTYSNGYIYFISNKNESQKYTNLSSRYNIADDKWEDINGFAVPSGYELNDFAKAAADCSGIYLLLQEKDSSDNIAYQLIRVNYNDDGEITETKEYDLPVFEGTPESIALTMSADGPVLTACCKTSAQHANYDTFVIDRESGSISKWSRNASLGKLFSPRAAATDGRVYAAGWSYLERDVDAAASASEEDSNFNGRMMYIMRSTEMPTVSEYGGHAYDDGVVTKEPTYTEEGETTYTCKICGGSYTEKIDRKTSPSKADDRNDSGDDSNDTVNEIRSSKNSKTGYLENPNATDAYPTNVIQNGYWTEDAAGNWRFYVQAGDKEISTASNGSTGIIGAIGSVIGKIISGITGSAGAAENNGTAGTGSNNGTAGNTGTVAGVNAGINNGVNTADLVSGSAALAGAWKSSAGSKYYWLAIADKTYDANAVPGSYAWYCFNENGIMQTGWITDGGKTYYLNAVPGTGLGKMFIGSREIDGKKYRFSEKSEGDAILGQLMN